MEGTILGKVLLVAGMDKESFNIRLEIYTLGGGKMIASMAKESTCFQVDKFMMGCLTTIKNKGLAHTTTIMPQLTIQETGIKI